MLTKAYFVGNSDLKVHSLREGGGVRTLGGGGVRTLGGTLGGGFPCPTSYKESCSTCEIFKFDCSRWDICYDLLI